MRKAATHYDCDLEFDQDDDAPPRTLLHRLLGESPGARIGSAALAALSLAIVVNALLLQDQRHAAPLFQMSLRAPTPAEEQVAPPLPAPRPVELAAAPQAKPVLVQRADAARVDPIGREIARIEQQPTRGEPAAKVDKSKTADARPAEAKHVDAIGGLIRNAGAVAAPVNEPDGSVMAAQRALMKLGFVLRPDGMLGGTTRQAIERFERDNHMPVRGELTPRIKAELARQSGVEID